MLGDGFRKRLKPNHFKEVRLARVSYHDMHIVCSCGWAYPRKRSKVEEDAIDRHFNRRHNGQGIRL